MQFLLLDFCEIGKYCIILSVVLDEGGKGEGGGCSIPVVVSGI